MIYLEQQYFVGEFGQEIILETGLNLADEVISEVWVTITRPNGSMAHRAIPTNKFNGTGAVTVLIAPTDFTAEGSFHLQVWAYDTSVGENRASPIFVVTIAGCAKPSVPGFVL